MRKSISNALVQESGRTNASQMTPAPRASDPAPGAEETKLVSGSQLEAAGDRASTDTDPGQEPVGEGLRSGKVVRFQLDGTFSGKHKKLGGSASDEFNVANLQQALGSLPFDGTVPNNAVQAVAGAMIGLAPGDEVEGMFAAQLIVLQHTAMDCFRLAHAQNHSFDRWRECLNQANKLLRTFERVVDARNRYRGKAQRIVVERVVVHDGGQAAIVGAVNR